jgi:hypothetical protein
MIATGNCHFGGGKSDLNTTKFIILLFFNKICRSKLMKKLEYGNYLLNK